MTFSEMNDFFWQVRRMCDIVLNNRLGNNELESLALYVGHDARVLNAAQPQENEDGQKPTTNKPSAKPCEWCRGRVPNKGVFGNFCSQCGFDLRTASHIG